MTEPPTSPSPPLLGGIARAALALVVLLAILAGVRFFAGPAEDEGQAPGQLPGHLPGQPPGPDEDGTVEMLPSRPDGGRGPASVGRP